MNYAVSVVAQCVLCIFLRWVPAVLAVRISEDDVMAVHTDPDLLEPDAAAPEDSVMAATPPANNASPDEVKLKLIFANAPGHNQDLVVPLDTQVSDLKKTILETYWPEAPGFPKVDQVERLSLFAAGNRLGGQDGKDSKSLKDCKLMVNNMSATPIHVQAVQKSTEPADGKEDHDSPDQKEANLQQSNAVGNSSTQNASAVEPSQLVTIDDYTPFVCRSRGAKLGEASSAQACLDLCDSKDRLKDKLGRCSFVEWWAGGNTSCYSCEGGVHDQFTDEDNEYYPPHVIVRKVKAKTETGKTNTIDKSCRMQSGMTLYTGCGNTYVVQSDRDTQCPVTASAHGRGTSKLSIMQRDLIGWDVPSSCGLERGQTVYTGCGYTYLSEHTRDIICKTKEDTGTSKIIFDSWAPAPPIPGSNLWKTCKTNMIACGRGRYCCCESGHKVNDNDECIDGIEKVDTKDEKDDIATDSNVDTKNEKDDIATDTKVLTAKGEHKSTEKVKEEADATTKTSPTISTTPSTATTTSTSSNLSSRSRPIPFQRAAAWACLVVVLGLILIVLILPRFR